VNFTPANSGTPSVQNITVGDGTNAKTVTLGANVAVVTGKTFTVNNAGTLNCTSSVVSGAGNFTLSAGATLGTGAAAGITSSGAAGNVQVTGTRTFDAGASYTYNGGAAQVTGNGLPASVNNLTISNGNGVSLTAGTAVGGTLALTGGALSIGANTLTLNGAVDNSGGGSLAGGSTSNVTFGGSGNSTTLPAITLNNLTLNRAGGIALGGNVTLSTLTLTSGSLSVGSGNTISVNSGGSVSASGGNLAGGSGGGAVAFAGAGTVSGTVGFNNVTAAGPVNFGTGSTVNNALTVLSTGGGVNTNPPAYANGSTLIYDIGSNNFRARGPEWSATSGAGYPYNVQISSGSFIDLGGASAGTARQMAGTLTVSGGGELSMAAAPMTAALTVLGGVSNGGTLTLSTSGGGDLRVQGDFTNNGTFAPNGGKVFFEGGGAQTVNASSGSLSIPYVRVNKSAGTVQLGNTDLSALGSSGVDSLQFAGTASTFTINGRTLTLGSTVSGGGSGSGLVGGGSSNLSLQDGGTGGPMGTLYFAGGGQALKDLTINRTGANASATIGSDVTVAGTLTLTSGDIIMSGTNTLTQTGTSAGTSDVIGNVKRAGFTNGLHATGAKSFGNPNVQLSFQTGTPASDVTLSLAKSAPTGFSGAVRRTYTVTQNGASGFSATLRLHYLDSELNGNAEAGLDLWRNNGSAWNRVVKTNADVVNAPNKWIESGAVTAFSPWTLATNLNVTAVEFGGARAESYAGGVLVTWGSGREVDNVGFNVYRELGGRRARVNESVIAGSALAVGAGVELRAGEGYRWFDAGASGAAQYWIEDIDLDGARAMHGPFVPVAGQGDGAKIAREYARPVLLGELNAKAQNKAGVFETGRPAADEAEGGEGAPASILAPRTGGLSKAAAEPVSKQWEVASRAGVKIGVKKEGWYRITQAELFAAGLDPNADPRFLQLYADGRQLPLRVNGAQAGLTPNSTIEFYGQGLDTPTADTRVYYLIAGDEPGLRVPAPRPPGKQSGGGKSLAGAGLAPPAPDSGDPQVAGSAGVDGVDAKSFAYTLERRERLLYFSSLLNGDAENYFGQLVGSRPVTETLTVRNLAEASAQPARLEVAMQGVSAGAHTLVVSFNGTQLDRLTFSAQEHASGAFDVPAALLREGDNSVAISVAGAETDLSLVDYLRLTYAHSYNADGDVLRFDAPARGGALVGGFTSPNVRVIDATDPASVAELPAQIFATADGYAARVQSAAGRTLLAFADETAQRVASVTPNAPSRWHESRSADMLIVAHGSLRESLTPLKALREREGVRVEIVDVEDLYDEFSFGAHTPQAVKDFLRWTTTHWQQSPRYVLFAGDATIDPRDYEGRGAGDLVPTKLIDTSSMEAPSDEWLADFDGGGVASMALGRLPARTPQDAALLVSKIVGFSPADAGSPAVLVSDRSGTNDLDFASASRSVAAQLPSGTGATFISRNDGTADAVRSQIVSAINAGPVVVNFIGHGSTARWTGDDLMRTADASALSNGSRLPLFVMMTCLNGYFTGTVGDSLAESVLKAHQGGAVAVWASSGTTVPVDQQTVNRELYRLIFSGAQSPALGDAVRRSKLLTQDPDIRRTWILFGDPSMHIR
jgi:hypothetical protein